MTELGRLLRESLETIDRLETRIQELEKSSETALAIVGAGCRYPGGVEGLDGLWNLVRDGVDAVSDIPADRWDRDAFYDADPKTPGKMICKRGGFLKQVDRFEPQLFGISPREAAAMDPQQRLLLETAWEALENAAIAPDGLQGSATGVFVGITMSDYGYMQRSAGAAQSDVYAATGSALNAAAGRVAFTFGLQGPCVAVDTACSSSLVAIHLACQSLRSGECSLALAGGVNVILSPDAMVLFSKWGMLAPDGACKTFDAAANGFVRSEGCAIVAIKRLADALAAGDPILAILRGSAVNSDGRSSGLTVPNGLAQRALIQKALTSAGLEPTQIDYVEAHGTGTSLGDPIEVEALGAVMGPGRPPERPLVIGSIKTNIGHCESASGIAGLLKIVASLQHETIPPHLHFTTPNAGIPWDRLPICVPTAARSWARGQRKRRAGVSSFGFTGTNAHVIVEEAPESAPPGPPGPQGDETVVIPLSARDEAALRAMAQRTADALAGGPVSLGDVASTTALGRAHLGRRLAIVGDSTEAVERDLRAYASGELAPSIVGGTTRPGERPKVAFVFTGQGAQYPGMGQRLYETEPVFRAALDRCAAILSPLLERPLLEVLFPKSGAATPLGDTQYTQPAIFAVGYALTELWRSWGVVPSVVLGHSVGEYVAATVAGTMSLEDGLALVTERGRAMQQLPSGGGMAAVFANEAEVSRWVAAYAGRLAIAALNGPEETVVSGDAGSLAELLASCEAAGIRSRALDVSHAFHSPLLDPMLDAFERRAAAVRFAPPRIALLSNLTGVAFGAGSAPDAAYWRRHAREPVRFAAGIEALRAAGVTAIVEVGPHPTLLALIARAAPDAAWTVAATLRRGRDDRREALSALAAVYARGASIDWAAVRKGRPGRRVALPTYPFQRQRYWMETAPQTPAKPALPAGQHPLLGRRVELAAVGTDVWENDVGLASHPWLGDHRVQGSAIVPATAYIEIALAAGRATLGAGPIVVTDIENLKALVIREGETHTIQTTLTRGEDGSAKLRVHSRLPGSPWTAHMTATVRAGSLLNGKDDRTWRAALDSVRLRCPSELDGAAFYKDLAANGNEWGPCFQGLTRVWLGEGEAIAHVVAPAAVALEMAKYVFHPAASDACGQTIGALRSKRSAFVGRGIGEVRLHRPPTGTTFSVHLKLRPQATSEDRLVVADLFVYDEEGLVSETIEARIWYLDVAERAVRNTDDAYYQVRWKSEDLGPPGERAADGARPWIIVGDTLGIGDALARRRAASGKRSILVAFGDRFAIDGDRVVIRAGEAEDARRVLGMVQDAAAVVHLGSIGARPGEAIQAGPESVLSFLRAILDSKAAPKPRLWLVTSDSQAAVSSDECGNPFGALLWGMGRTLSVEDAGVWGGLIDVSARDDGGAIAEQVWREAESGGEVDQVALRNGQRYAARLVRFRPEAPDASAYRASLDGTHLVTGGLGGIGLAVAGWLVEHGARNLLLIGRAGLPPRETWQALASDASATGRRIRAVRAIEDAGAKVEVAAIDVADEGAVGACLADRGARGEPSVRGVFHAAGLLQFHPLSVLDPGTLREALVAKAGGGWCLHRLFENAPLDYFVLCSSSSALLRSPLLGAYAAGNAFLDALAHHRRARGRTALSINWGIWAEVGMATEVGRERGGGTLAGMGTLSTKDGLAALGTLLASDTTQAAVMPVDWEALARAYPAFARDPFVQGLVDPNPRESNRRQSLEMSKSLRGSHGETRFTLVSAYLLGEAARTLRLPEREIDPAVPLASFGFDSLMAVQLKNQIEADLGIVVPMMRFLGNATLGEIGQWIAKTDDGDALPSRSTSSGDETDETWEEGSL